MKEEYKYVDSIYINMILDVPEGFRATKDQLEDWIRFKLGLYQRAGLRNGDNPMDALGPDDLTLDHFEARIF